MSNSKNFLPERIPEIRSRLEQLPEEKINLIFSLDLKDPTVMIIISAVIGELGIDRFMLGDIGLGVLKLLTLGGCLIWWFIDIFFIGKITKEKNYETFIQFLMQF